MDFRVFYDSKGGVKKSLKKMTALRQTGKEMADTYNKKRPVKTDLFLFKAHLHDCRAAGIMERNPLS